MDNTTSETAEHLLMPPTTAINEVAFAYYPALERVWEMVHEKRDAAVTLTDAAEVAGLEVKYFSAFFRSRVGINFTTWHNRTRISWALERLKRRDLRISDLAYDLGFRDLSTFQRAFKRHTGMTPTAARATLRPTLNSPLAARLLQFHRVETPHRHEIEGNE